MRFLIIHQNGDQDQPYFKVDVKSEELYRHQQKMPTQQILPW